MRLVTPNASPSQFQQILNAPALGDTVIAWRKSKATPMNPRSPAACSASTRCKSASAWAAWARSIARATPASTAMSPSRSFRALVPRQLHPRH